MEIKIPSLEIKEVGLVREVKYGIAKVEGLPSCIYGQLVEFSEGPKGMVIGFDQKAVSIIVLGSESGISVGGTVSSQAELISVPVGEGLIGRMVNSLGEPIDGKQDISVADFMPVFREAPGVIEREPITEPLLTGIKIIDLVIPIGKGQRELIIGDRQTGKSTIGLDTIINQKDKDVICIYCWIGGPQSALKKHLYTLSHFDAFKYTIVVSASAESSAAEQYLAPYSTCAIGEYFVAKGKDVLVVFDDLTKHAWIYRQMSLLLERSPGREAYSGDIFYLHSQFMERAGKFRKEEGGGSMTFLPIAETLQGDITGYIQTNLISMTDGQIYISTALFREGFKPAIDLGLSVSRIGNKVQYPAIREVGQGLRLEYTQYRSMLRLTKLRTRLSTEAMEAMQRGEALRELFLQPSNQAVTPEKEIVLFYAFKRKVLENLAASNLKKFIEEFFEYLSLENPNLIAKIKETKELGQEIKAGLDRAFMEFFRKLKSIE